MKNSLVLALALSACAVETETADTEQAIASTAAIQVCRTDTANGVYANLTIHGLAFYGYEPEELQGVLNSYWGGWTWTTVATATTDCSGNLSMTGQLQLFGLEAIYIHEPSTNTYLTVPLPANGACAYTGGYAGSTWSYPLNSCGGSSGGGGGTGGGGSHLLM